MVNTLSKAERLSSRSDIARLLSEGRYGDAGCVRYCFLEGTSISRILLSVRKKDIKRAVRRNLIKRRLREAYRLQKNILVGCPADIMFIYKSKELLPFSEIFSSMGLALTAIRGRLERTVRGAVQGTDEV